MRTLVTLAVLFALSACSSGIIVLKDPATGNVAQCSADAWSNWNPRGATQACAKAYEAAGYVRMKP